MLPLLLVLVLLGMPVLEIFVIIQLGGAIGAWPTVGLLAAEFLLGAWIVRREGRRAWRALQDAVGRGVMPDRELADAALIMAGGVLLLTPGFVTDVFGLLFILPFTRPLVRRALSGWASRRMRAAADREAYAIFPPGFGPGPGRGPGPGPGSGPGSGPDRDETPPGPVVRGEVVD
ncbi:hypothetical protein GCM10022254_12790 [Actinomadura meridiana]|uniref:FxsA family protein n=1 Tax=Actinomadura meridiana TaxID=559626 RepID=A0ABP8BUN2_9ACTN